MFLGCPKVHFKVVLSEVLEVIFNKKTAVFKRTYSVLFILYSPLKTSTYVGSDETRKTEENKTEVVKSTRLC